MEYFKRVSNTFIQSDEEMFSTGVKIQASLSPQEQNK